MSTKQIIVAIVAAVIAAASASGAVLTTTPAAFRDAWAAANSGDTIVVSAGTITSGMYLTNKSGITVGAQEIGKTFITGGQVYTGAENRLIGFVIHGARTPWWDGALLPGLGSIVQDVVVRDNDTIGICIRQVANVKLIRVKSLHNGCLGMNSGANAGGWCSDLYMEDIEISDNNYGMSYMPGGDPAKVYRASDGKWYRVSFDEGGGVKLTRTKGVNKIVRGKFFNNGGPGLWTDVQGNDWDFIDCEAAYNHNTPDKPTYEGPGFAAEIGERVRWINCYGHHNSGSAFAFWESPFTQMLDCVTNQTGVEFRDITTRGTYWRIRDITVDKTRTYNGTKVSMPFDAAYMKQNRIVVQGTQALNGVPTWLPAGTTPTPPIDPPTPPAESPDGTRGQQVVDYANSTWTITAAKKIAHDGKEDPGTNDVRELGYKNKTVYQQATADPKRWWKWTGMGWQEVSDPFAAPPTTLPIDDVLALKAKILELEKLNSSISADRDKQVAAKQVEEAKNRSLQTELNAANDKIAKAKAELDK